MDECRDWTMEKFKDKVFKCDESRGDRYYMEKFILDFFDKLAVATIELKSQGKTCEKCFCRCLEFTKEEVE